MRVYAAITVKQLGQNVMTAVRFSVYVATISLFDQTTPRQSC